MSTQEPDVPPSETRPRLAIRRPTAPQTRDREHLNAAAAAVDARVRKAERQRRIARIKKTVGNWISIVALLALLWIGFTVWQTMQKKELPTCLPVSMTQVISNVVEKINGEIAQ